MSSAAIPGSQHLLVFARLPEPGKTKTRLIPALGPERAAQIYEALARQTLATVQRFQSRRACQVKVFVDGGDPAAWARSLGNRWHFEPQRGCDLGQRLANAIQSTLEAGAGRVVVIGTDCVEFTEQHLGLALDELTRHDVVIGPAEDGGYYLIGLHQDAPELFQGIEWGTGKVLEQTLAAAARIGKRICQLPRLRDIDYPEDLVRWRGTSAGRQSGLFPESKGRISVIIPARNEAQRLPQTLGSARGSAEDLEIIVVDGGSEDKTLEAARAHGCVAFAGTPGRGRQMNAGAAVASGEYLLFLHADTLLPAGYAAIVRRCLEGGHVAGAFRLGIEGRHFGLGCIQWAANLRSHLLHLPYGDQAIFLRAATFFELGGYSNDPIMEDYALVKRLGQMGNIRIVQPAVRTSGRRWQHHGIFATTLRNLLCVLAFELGLSPARIARIANRF